MRILGAVVVCMPVFARAQPAPQTERWEAVVTITTDATSIQDTHDGRHTAHVATSLHTVIHLTGVLDAAPSAGSWSSVRLVSVSGSGTSHVSNSSHEVYLDVDSDHHKDTIDGTEEGTDVVDPTLIKPDEMTFTAGEAGIVLAVTVHMKGSTTTTETRTTWKGTKKTVQTSTHDGSGGSPYGFYGTATKAMADAHRFTGTQTDNGDPKANAAMGMTQSMVTTVDIHPLGPVAKADLIVDIPGYDKWLPDPNAPIVVTATLKPKGGKLTDVKLSKLHFKLTGTSAEPGESLNFPVTPNSNEKDLGLTSKGGREIGNDKQEIEYPFANNSEQVAVFANDWGGWGDLVVTGDLSDGTTVTGHLAGKPEGPILFPYRTGGSHIGEAWKKQQKVAGKADDEDEETKPAGKADTNGDGFALYEEYRGVECGGAHIRLDPNVKDLFVRNEVGAEAKVGIANLAKASQLAIHDCLADSELASSRIVNANHSGGAHVVDQHAIRLTASGGANGGKAEEIGTPGEVGKVEVDTLANHLAINGETREDWDTEVAHELLHSLGVEHHGQQDKYPVKWEWEDETHLREYGDSMTEITVEDENGRPITRHDPDMDLLWPGTGALGGKDRTPMSSDLMITYPHGESSGDDSCIMSYGVGTSVLLNGKRVYVSTFVDMKRPNVRHLVKRHEPLGAKLCTSSKGTGTNATGRSPLQWHGDAQLGDCAHQFVVSDRHPVPKHEAKKN